MLESNFWPKVDVDAVVKFYLPILEEMGALAAYIRVGDTDEELDKPSGYKSPGDRLQLTVIIRDEIIDGKSSALIASERFKVGENLWGEDRSVFVRYPISIPFFPGGIQTLEQAIEAFIKPDKDHQIYPLVHQT